MSTIAITPREFPRPGLGRLTSLELRKASDTRAGAWLLGLTSAATVVVALIRALTGAEADQGLTDILSIALFPANIVLPVLGILLVTSEWSQKTALSTFALVPDRGRVIRAKVFAALGLGFAAFAVALVVSVLVTAVTGGAWSLSAGDLGQGVFALLLTVIWGLVFGLVFAASAPAIVSYFVLPALFSLLAEIVTSLDGTWEWVDPNRALVELMEFNANGSDWAHLGVSGTIWIVLPFAVGVVRLLRREVK